MISRRMMTVLAIACAVAGGPRYAMAAGGDVLVWAGGSEQDSADRVAAELTASGYFDSVTGIAQDAAFTLSELTSYDKVFYFSNHNGPDSEAIGDVLADFAETGRRLVLCTFAWANQGSNTLGGRIISEEISPLIVEGSSLYSPVTMTSHDGSVFFDGVTNVDGLYHDDVQLTAGAVSHGTWSDDEPMVASKGSVVGVNLFPDDYFGEISGDFLALFANSLRTCGDGVLVAGEQCDDGNVSNADCCTSSCTVPICNDGDPCTQDSCAPASGCVYAGTPLSADACYLPGKAAFAVSDSATAGKDKIAWQWSNGAAFAQADLGAPNTDAGTTYTLCVYDENAPATSLEASIDIAPSPANWTAKDGRGFLYKDPTGSSAGIAKAQLKTGAHGKTKVKVAGGGPNLVLPAPAGSTFFAENTRVLVQLVSSAGKCWTSEFVAAGTKKNEADSFKAKAD